jgi:FtsZ-interacting cell division protein YlmF
VSEYQYYEFVAIDQPLTPKQQNELRSVSTRGRITSSSFVNDYQWGDLKADPAKWMEQYFDVHLYLANWGTRRFMVRLPLSALAFKTAAMFCVGDWAASWATRTHVVIDLRSEDEGGDEDWWEQEGQLAAIVPARAALAAGDRRLLYLGWLLCVQNQELDDDELEPPVPPGLTELPGPLQSLADFLRLDPDLLAAAGEKSERLTPKTPSGAVLRKWVRGLSTAEKDDVVLRIMRGEDAMLRPELLRRFHGQSDDSSGEARRTVGELLTAAEERSSHRQQRDQEREAAERKRAEEAAAAAREDRLNALASDSAEAWNQVDVLIATKRPKEYDGAVALLRDLQDLSVREGEIFEFAEQMTRLRERHARKPSLIDRFNRTGLD